MAGGFGTVCLLIWLRWFVAICCLLGGGLCYWLPLADLLVCLTSFCWVGCLRSAGLYGDCLVCEFGLGGTDLVWWLRGGAFWVGLC